MQASSVLTVSNSSQSQNISYLENDMEKGLKAFLSISSCLTFLYINMVMLYTLRSKQVFRETSRYILLYNLLLAETLQMALCQILFILATARVFMVRYMCIILSMFAILTTDISPLNLAVMSLERYVAVCFPLRHATLVTIRSTGVAIAMLWTMCSVSTLFQGIMLIVLDHAPINSMMQDFCAKEIIFQLQIFIEFNKCFVCTLFVSVGLVIIFSYINVMIAARSASSDESSVNKASKTLLLHFIQLCLSLSSTLVATIVSLFIGKVDRLTIVRIQYVLFIFSVNLPRCLSCLIYGLRDQTIRPILMLHLRLGIRWPGTLNKH